MSYKDAFRYTENDLLDISLLMLNKTGLNTKYYGVLINPEILPLGFDYVFGIGVNSPDQFIGKGLFYSCIVLIPNIKKQDYSKEVKEWQYLEIGLENDELKMRKIGEPDTLSTQMKMMFMSLCSFEIDLTFKALEVTRMIDLTKE